ncbi:MAG: mercury(II) reductase [Calditrichaeota bacterium]|nr:MAG: mercury(II) reductase [Calditrichota bacterium]MBL1207207.1 mercury(II) reductase [Calditrichota bacterium]NOG47040.1 mercury(II) reductase [Calditrichota bacterium]
MKIKTLQLDIKGMTCDHCATSIEKKLDADGIIEKSVSYKEAGGQISFDENKISSEDITNLVNGLGHYKVTGSSELQENFGNENHLIIIGGGSAAFAATIQARKHGAKVTMINGGLPIGGTCVNVGCVPSKNLIRAAEAMHKANHNPFSGVESSGRLTSFKDLIKQKSDLVLDLRQQKYINVIKDMENFRKIEGRAKITSPTTVEVNGKTISGSHILLATGARPLIPNIPGLNDVPFLTNEEAFELEELPKSVIVLGGRYIALEIAQMFSRLGSKVTILQRSDRILPTETADLTDELTGYFEEEGITVVAGNNLVSVNKKDGQISVESLINGETRHFEAEKMIVATGRQANTSNMGLQEIGVELNSSGFVKVNDNLQTSVSTIYSAGDVLGENMFVYTAAYEGKLAANNMFNPVQKERDYTALPWVVFTDPQVAGVGLDENQAAEKGIEADTAVLLLSHVPRAIAAKDTRGFIKLIRDKNTDKLIGARILAPEGSELLMEVAMVIKFGITTEQIIEMFHPYLILGEGIKLAAITFSKSVEELSCCAT